MPNVDDYFARVALGRVEGHKQYLQFGVNEDVDSNGSEDILSQGGNVQILSTEQPCDIVSTSALDTLGGTGCNVVAVFGVNQNMNIVEEVVTLNGTTPVALQNNYIAIWRLRNAKSGSTRLNQGTIQLNTLSNTLLGTIPPLKGSNLSTLMVVPRGYRMLVYDVFINIGLNAPSGSTRKASVTVRTLDYYNNAETVQAQVGLREENAIIESFRMPLTVPECYFIWLRADNVEVNDSAVTASYVFELVNV